MTTHTTPNFEPDYVNTAFETRHEADEFAKNIALLCNGGDDVIETLTDIRNSIAFGPGSEKFDTAKKDFEALQAMS